jgi:hypothetical protein
MGARRMNARKKAKRLRHSKTRQREAAASAAEDSSAKPARRRAKA